MTAILGQYLATIFRTVFWFLKLSPEKKIHAYKKKRTITFRAVSDYKLNVTNKENKKKTIFSCVKKLYILFLLICETKQKS